jgi:tetratricopeptide (TPR) repeat protein
VYSVKGDLDRAIADYGQAIKINPNYVNAYYNRGNMYLTKGDNNKAISDLEAVLRINPNDTEARALLEKTRQQPKSKPKKRR